MVFQSLVRCGSDLAQIWVAKTETKLETKNDFQHLFRIGSGPGLDLTVRLQMDLNST
jgi:hypothetical protein